MLSLIHLISFLAFLSPVFALLYRVENRPPVQVREEGGIKAWNPDGDGSVFDHVRGTLGTNDPWVSTTSSYDFAKNSATMPSDIYIYKIDNLEVDSVDTIKAFRDANLEHPHPGEKEFAVKGIVEWDDAITGWDVYRFSKLVESVDKDDWEEANPQAKRKARAFFA
ncbi:ADP-ribosylation [Poronia punctata]|nr:ADP-ribosylation [Poronia punctata]